MKNLKPIKKKEKRKARAVGSPPPPTVIVTIFLHFFIKGTLKQPPTEATHERNEIQVQVAEAEGHSFHPAFPRGQIH